MELKGKEKRPLKHKDVVKLEDLQLMHPSDLTEAQTLEKEKLIARRNQYGQ